MATDPEFMQPLGEMVSLVYDEMEADVMMELLAELQNELRGELPVNVEKKSTTTVSVPSNKATSLKRQAPDENYLETPSKRQMPGDQLLDLVATPAMMQAFSALIRSSSQSVSAC